MEGINLTGEHDSDDDGESGGKKKKSAEALGAFVIEPKTQTSKAEKPQSFLEELLGKKAETATDDAEIAEEGVEDGAELAELSAEETLFAEQEIVRDRQAASGEAPSGAEIDETAVTAELAVERFRDKIVAEDMDSSQALAETLDELEIETPDESPDEIAESEPEETIETPQEFTEEPVELNRPADDEAVTKDDTATTAAAGSAASPPRGTGPTGTGAAGATTGGGRGTGAGHAAAGGAVPPFVPAPGTLAPSPATGTEYVHDNTDFVAGALVGGIVGYLLGRRRGRIKTERRLLPVQRRLEQQVERLQQDIVAKEFTIRQAAIEQAHDRKLRSPVELAEQRATRQPAVEAARLHSSAPVEKIGEVLITAQAEATPSLERADLEPIDKHVETLSRADLLELSSKIMIEGTSLRRAYETNLISEKALRRIVIEHLRGGDVRAALRQELVEHQIDFERDPQLRDLSLKPTNNDSPALNDLVQQATSQIPGVDQSTSAATRVKQAYQQQNKQQHRRVFDAVMMGTIGVLIVLIIVLLLTRA